MNLSNLEVYRYKHLQVGDIIISNKKLCVFTLLGSCVALTFFCKRLNLGGICHALLPGEQFMRSGRDFVNEPQFYKYLPVSFFYLLDRFLQKGCAKEELQIKLFGGSQVMQTTNGVKTTVGNQNLQMAKKLVSQSDLHIAAEVSGGTQGYKLLFLINQGDIYCKRLPMTAWRFQENISTNERPIVQEVLH
jgi:chemotaxis protein CheD